MNIPRRHLLTAPRHALSFALLVVMTLALLLPLDPLAWTLTRSALAAGPTITVVGSATTIRPDTALPSPTTLASMTAAQNEFESFQIVVQAGDSPINDFRAQASNLIGPGGAVIAAASNITLYREAYYNVTTPSRNDSTGLWPDALIPDVDPYYSEQRNAFVDHNVPANERVVVWVDVLVPNPAPAGRYTGKIFLSGTGLAAGTAVDVEITVQNFAIPSTSTLDNAFLTQYAPNDTTICQGHFDGNAACGNDNTKRWSLYSLYARAALENRITISNPWPLDAGDAPTTSAQQTAFDQYILPLIQGTSPQDSANLWKPVRLAGAKLTSLSIYSEYCLETCIAKWKLFAEQRGFGTRMFAYACDEPGVEDWQTRSCMANASNARNTWPGLPVLITAAIQNAEKYGDLSKIDILVPLVNNMHGKAELQRVPAGNQRDQYNDFLAQDTAPPANRLWMYTSCMSYGCGTGANDDPTSLYTGWPGYAIDAAATEARAIGWLSFKYKTSGELYYQTTRKLNQAWNSDLFIEGANGDGTLFYPGTPAEIGGTHDIPVESIRLKRIRDGREDYEYLHILKNKGPEHESFARAVADQLFPTMYDAAVSQQKLDAARAQLAAKIESLSSVVLTGRIVFDSKRDDSQGEIYTLDADGSNLQRLTTQPGEDSQPALSRDGTQIAFTSTRDDAAGDIYVMNVEGSDVRRLTTSAGRDEKPVWSPDDSKLAFVSHRNGNMDIFVMDATAGANQTNHTPDSPFDDFDPTWSPEGLGMMAFASTRDAAEDCGGGRSCGSEIYRSGGSVRLTRSPGDDDNPSWSRTTWELLVFDSLRDGNYEVYSMEPSGGLNLKNLTNSPATQDYKPVLSPDDRWIAFTRVANGDAEVYVKQLTDGAEQNVTRSPTADDAPDWSIAGNGSQQRVFLPFTTKN